MRRIKATIKILRVGWAKAKRCPPFPEQRCRRAERLAAQLKALGIEPQ
ncbi:MAG: hypothetical protein HC877_12945 [Thioploca sp.]|nr:hypothetical protein [Thioploca sp.]